GTEACRGDGEDSSLEPGQIREKQNNRAEADREGTAETDGARASALIGKKADRSGTKDDRPGRVAAQAPRRPGRPAKAWTRRGRNPVRAVPAPPCIGATTGRRRRTSLPVQADGGARGLRCGASGAEGQI